MHFVCVVTGMYISTIMVMNKDECNDKEDLDILGEMKSSLPEQIYLLCSVVMKIKLLTTFYLAPYCDERVYSVCMSARIAQKQQFQTIRNFL